MKKWLKENRQLIFNILLFLCFFDIAFHQVVFKVALPGMPVQKWYMSSIGLADGAVDFAWYSVYWDWSWLQRADWSMMTFVEWSFLTQNVLMVFLILLRRKHRSVDSNCVNQIIALLAFGSGVFFMGESASSETTLFWISAVVLAAANLIGVIALLNLGRNFGILIALRQIETKGIYDVVRHPMYGGDILLRVGYLVSHFSPVTMALFVGSTACYIYRAILEERFLGQTHEYQDYMNRVRYRFIPFIF